MKSLVDRLDESPTGVRERLQREYFRDLVEATEDACSAHVEGVRWSNTNGELGVRFDRVRVFEDLDEVLGDIELDLDEAAPANDSTLTDPNVVYKYRAVERPQLSTVCSDAWSRGWRVVSVSDTGGVHDQVAVLFIRRDLDERRILQVKAEPFLEKESDA